MGTKKSWEGNTSGSLIYSTITIILGGIAMIRGKDIESLVELLVQRDVSLFHACQFLDFQSYLSVGGVPSRACLEAYELPFTGFETDGHDHVKGVWDKVFLNFSDFGKTFAQGGRAVPNAYGPILLQFIRQCCTKLSM
jgi:hypothetical protein